MNRTQRNRVYLTKQMTSKGPGGVGCAIFAAPQVWPFAPINWSGESPSVCVPVRRLEHGCAEVADFHLAVVRNNFA